MVEKGSPKLLQITIARGKKLILTATKKLVTLIYRALKRVSYILQSANLQALTHRA